MLRNENIPVVHQVHAYDDADVALTMALPWVHELGWPPNHCDPAAGPDCFLFGEPAASLVISSLEVAFFHCCDYLYKYCLDGDVYAY